MPLVTRPSRLLTGAVSRNAWVAAVSPRAGDCSRVLTRFRWVKPRPRAHPPAPHGLQLPQPSRLPAEQKLPAQNVAERLALGKKTVSFCQCRFDNETATDNEAGMPNQSRAHSSHHHCDEPRPAASLPVDNRATTAVLSPQPVDNFVDRSSSFLWSSLDRPQGGTGH